ncbi:agmatine deiminase family protein [Deltaproteobacteria bacterium PRO3]|nr:agmatine deiminase family protein [Deltaproteobacteria bacterium PRO3]
MPAEWEPHEATWLSWPKDPITWPDRVPQAQEAFARMIEALTPREKVHLLVNDAEAEAQVRGKLAGRVIRGEHLLIHRIPTVDSWIRDYGPNFLKGPRGLAYNRWIFNAWGGKYETLMRDDGIPQRVSHLINLPMFEPGIVMEGGSIEVNGAGCVLTTEQCLLNPNRNPHLSRAAIEKYLQDFLGVSKVLWLGDGIEGDDTDGHVDDITRFVAADTIVTAVEEDPADANYQPLQDNLLRLRAMSDVEGRPFRIVTLPMPGRVESDEGPLPASYANFYIANGVVLVPVYAHANDARALATLQGLFPDRKVVGIDCRDLVWGMGAIHCVTQQQPA